MLGISSTRPVVLASFGGHGLSLSYVNVAELNDVTLLVTDHEAAGTRAHERLHVFATRDMQTRGIRYADLVAAADLVISKPGYGIVSECIANGAALLYTRRGHFIEQEVFVREMPRLLRTREISRDDLMAGRWSEDVELLLQQPPAPGRAATDGAVVARNEILRVADGVDG